LQRRVASYDALVASHGPAAISEGDAFSVTTAAEADLDDLLVLMRAYCDFYEVNPRDEALLALARELIADPAREGVQLIARDGGGEAVGFATVFWSWSTASAARIGIMNDLYVAPSARGRGLAEKLIATCAERCSQLGAVALEWQTAPDNSRAQAVYDRVGGRRERWLTYTLAVPTRP
jgi:GNAT superfamily N-acetyltransferase